MNGATKSELFQALNTLKSSGYYMYELEVFHPEVFVK